MLAIVAALSSQYGRSGNTNVNGANATITFIFLFGIVYSFTYTPLQALYCAEVMNQKMRAKGMAGEYFEYRFDRISTFLTESYGSQYTS